MRVNGSAFREVDGGAARVRDQIVGKELADFAATVLAVEKDSAVANELAAEIEPTASTAAAQIFLEAPSRLAERAQEEEWVSNPVDRILAH